MFSIMMIELWVKLVELVTCVNMFYLWDRQPLRLIQWIKCIFTVEVSTAVLQDRHDVNLGEPSVEVKYVGYQILHDNMLYITINKSNDCKML